MQDPSLSGDSLAILIFLVGTGLCFMTPAIQESVAWRKLFFGAISAASFIIAALYLVARSYFPEGVSLLTRITNNPASWFNVGLLLMCIYVRRPSKKATEPASKEIDRAALADEADGLTHKISVLLTEHSTKMTEQWWNENEVEQSSARLRSIDAIITEKFSEKYAADFWRVVSSAQTCIKLDRQSTGDVWHLAYIIDAHGLRRIPRLLSAISVALRYPATSTENLDQIVRTL